MLDGELACVDLETTGGHPLLHRVIEVGIVTLRGGAVVDEWSSLVNPGGRIPRNISAFTGITDEMVADAPSFADLRGEVLARLEGRLFVAHNARFDYGFLRNEFRRLGLRFRAPVLCTVKLSRRMDAGERGHSLDAVMARHGIECQARHRALGDAQVLARFLPILQRRHAADELERVVSELVQESPLPPQLDPELLEDLPEGPGVYRFWGENDALLYVGKSVNLRTRVLSHFAADHRDSKELKLSRQVRRVDWQETAGEFGALLLESRWVKELEPLHNRRLRAARECWTIVLDTEGDGLRARVAEMGALPASGSTSRGDASLSDDGASPHFFGTFRAKRDATKALDEIVRAHQLCRKALGLEPGEGSCFGFQVGRCRGACAGREPAALHAARAQLAFAPHRLRPWPFRGRLAICERDWRGEQQLHVFDHWRYVGTARDEDSLAALDRPAGGFDIDTYRILERLLRKPPPRTRLVELD
ncbi:MAG: exonuclease domain-containing protein [Steroidobacteraceae bacterium]|jgi:DNA polymerase-3 subunit epsilon|nr:exonuclease domain-containing protein [Steroidobacteraceae bacterium]